MGVLRQFGALLWKNYVLRKRKPVFLLLEVLWPVIIFVVIALVRRGVPPVPSESCYYQERALPSAGMLPFLQTSVCTLNNPCLSQGQVEQKAAAQERLRSMLYKVEPYIRKNTTLEAFEVLPTIAKVFHMLKTKLNDTILEEFGDRLMLKNLLQDEEKIVDILVDEYKLMSEDQARDLLESSLNPYEFIKAVSNIDFKDVACDKTKLTKYVFFPKRTDVAAVSASLCAIDDELISNITNEVVRQIDIVNLIKFGEEFAKFMGEFDYAVLLHDIANLMEVYIDKSGLLAAITDLPDLSMIPKMFDKMAEIIPAFEKLGAIDMESIWSLYDLMYPFMDSIILDESTKDVLRQTADSLKEWTTSLNSNSNVSDIDFRKMVNVTSSLTEVFNSMGNMSYISDILDSMNFNSLYETLEAFVNGYKWDDVLFANMQSANMAGLENLARSMLSNTTVTMMMEISYKVTEMLINMMDSYSAMDAELRYFVTVDKDVMDTNVLNIFIQMGPKMTTAFMTEILEPTTYEPLILGKTDAQSLCKNITHKIYGEKERAVADYWNTYLCSGQMVDRFEQLRLGSIYQYSMTQMENSMEYVSYIIENPDSITKPANMSMVYAKISQLANQTTHIFMDNTKLWTDILTDGPYNDYNTGDEAEWYYAWSNVSSAMFMTDMVLSMKQMGESMEGTELWTYLMPSAVAMEAYMAAQAEPYRMMQDMMDPSTPMGMLMENMEYLPDILPTMMTFMNSEDGQREMQAFYTDPLKAVCEDHILWRMNMPNTVPVGDIEKSICDMDWEKFGEDLMETMDWMGSMQKKIDAYNFNGTMSSVDWDGLAENMHMYLTAMNAPNEIAKDFEHLMNKMNVTKLLENLGKMDQNGMQNITMDEVNGTISAIVSAMEGLDKSLVNVSFWSYGKHVARLWMAYTNIANDVFLHTKDGINLTDYIKTISPTLGDYFLNISTKFPSLFDEIMKNVQNPQTILSATLNTNWEKLCNGTKISTILQLRTTEGIEEFERGMCELNWTAIMEEIIDYNPNIKIYSDELSILAEPIDKAPRTTVNWTDLATGTMKMIENLQDWFTSNMSQQVHGIDANSVNMTLEDFMKTLTQVDEWDATKFGGIAQELTDLLYNQDMGDNSTLWNLVMQSNMHSLYVSYHFLKFANLQLEYINTTNPVDLKKYLDSEEANKVFRAMEVSNEVNAALFGNLKDYATNPQKMTELLTSNLSAICDDETSFGKLFSLPANSNLTMPDLEDTVCGVNLNITKLVSELERSVPGFKDFLEAMSKVETMAAEGLQKEDYVNITQYTAENERFSKLLGSILTHPPNITVFWASPDDDMSWFIRQLEDFANFTTSGFGNQQITTTFGTIQQHLGEALSGIAESSPEIGRIMYIADAYLRMLEHSIIQNQRGLWEDPRASLAGYPEMMKVWDLMEELPELFETFQYTLAYDNKKISTFISLLIESFDKLCAADPTTLMTVPPRSNFRFDQFMSELCDINVTVLERESNEYNGGQIVIDAYTTIDNITEPTNITAMFQRLDELYNTLIDMSNNTNTTEMDVPRFLDVVIWLDMFYNTEQFFKNSTLNTVNETSILSQIMDSIDELQTSMPDIRPYLNVLDLYLSVYLHNTQHQLDIRQDPANAFLDFPEMRKMWLLMDELPELYQTYVYTTFMAPDKISNFTETLMSGFESLCAADPADLMIVPPDLNFDFAAFYQKLCAVNLTVLAEESMRYNSQDNITRAYENFNNLTNPVNLNDMAKKISDLTKMTQEIYTFNMTGEDLPRFLNFSLWEGVLTTVSNWSMDPDMLAQLASNSQSLISMLSGLTMTEEDKVMMRTLEALNMLFDNVLDKLEAKKGTNETLRIEDFFTTSTELLKLIKLLQSPGMMEILLYASNNPQVSTILTNPNTTDAIDELCAKDWVTFLNLPEKQGVNFTALQQEFCALNFSVFLDELYKEFKLSDVIEKISSNDTVDWRLISEQNQKLSERFSNFLSTPPQFELPSLWTNETMWSELFTTYNEALSNLSTLAERIGSTLGNSDSLLSSLSDMGLSNMEASMLRSMEAVNMFMETMLDKLESKNGTDVSWKLEDFFTSSVEVLKIVRLLQKTGMMEILLYSANNPQFSAIYMNENTTTIIDDLCALNWEEVLRLPEKQSVNYTALQEEFCAVNFSAILPELYKEFNMQAVIDKMSSNATVDWQYITQQNERLNERINKLITSPPKFDLPAHWTNDTVWHDLFTTYSEFLNNMNQLPDTGSLVNQVFSSFNNEDINKMGAIANILMDDMIKLLENYPEEINLDFLLNNNTELRTLVDVLGTLSYTGADDFSNGNIDVSKLLGLILNPVKLEEACNDRSILNMISRYNVTETVLNIEKIVCMDTEAVSQALMNFQGNQDVSDKIAQILNSSEPVQVDWKTVGSKVDTLTKLMTDQFSRNITTSVAITELLNINNTLPILESLLTNPGIIGQMTGVLRPWVDKEMVDIIHPVIAQMLDMMNMLQEKNVTLQSLLTNQDMLNDVIASLNTFDTQMGTYVEHAVKPAIDLAATMPTVQSAVCSVPTLEAKAQTVPTMGINVNKVSQVLCGKASNEWFDSLLDAGFTQTQIIGTKALLESLYTPITDQTDWAWARFTDTVIHLIMAARRQIETELDFTHDGTEHGEPEILQEFDFIKLMNETLNSFISYMKIVDSDETVQDSLHELKQFFTSVTSMQTFMNEQLEKGREAGKTLNLTRLLPDPELVAKMLNGMQGKEYTDIITLLSLYPEKFLTIYKNGQWEEVACNPTKFYTEFQVEDGFDAEGIRKSICEAVTTNSSVFSEVLNNIQMADLINELTDWLTDGQTMPVNANVWDEFLSTSNQFLKNVADLQNIDIDSLIAYGESLLKHLEKLSAISTSTSSYTVQCESTLQQFYGTEMYDTTILPILNSVYTQTYLQYKYQILAEDMLEVMCEEQASNVTRLVDLLKMSGVPEKLKQLAKETTEGMTFSCEGMVNVSLLYAEAMNRSFSALTDQMDQHAECLEGQMNMMLAVLGDVTQLFEVGKVMLRELNNKDFREFLTTIAGSEDILEVMEYVLQGFVQQQNWVEETNDKIQSNITELESYLEDALKISPNVLQSLVNATLKKDMGNLTAEDVVNALCGDLSSDPTNNFLAFFNSSVRDAIGLDCNEDRNTTFDVVNTLLALSKLTERLQTNIDTNSIAWWMELGQDFSELASNIQGLSELTSLIDNINDLDLENIIGNGELLVTIQRLLINSGPESLIDNLNNILEKFGEMNDDSRELFNDMQILTRGMLSFTTLRRLIISNVQIKDLLKEPDHFQQYLIDSIDIPKDIAQSIVDGSLSFELLINASQANLTDWICEPEKLADILNISGSQIDHKFVSESFCNLDTDMIARILDEVFKQLDIGDLVEEFITTSIDDILRDSGTSKKEVEDALDSLQNANDDLKEVIDEFGDYAANMTDVISALAQAQIGTTSPSSLSELICGESLSDIEDEFSLGDSLPSAETLTDEQKEELAELKADNEVCEKLYLDIMSTSGGPIIWGYLKPIMRGKILFSPNNEITKGIIEKINATFATIADFQEDASKLSSGATSLDNITSGEQDIVKLLSSPLVESFITQFSSSGSGGFEDLIYMLNDSSSDLVSAMSKAASFMGDYIHCIELDRFIGYNSEAELEQHAANLAGKNVFLAGIVFTNADQRTVRKKRDSHLEIPTHLMYKIRMDVDNVEQTQTIKDRIWRPISRGGFADDLRYLRGFIQLQDMVDSAIIETMTGAGGTRVQPITKQTPFPCHKRDTFLNALVAYLLPVMMTFAWLAGLALATYNLVLDREDGQEETLKAMGLVFGINWWAWFISTMFIMAVVSVICTIISHYAEILPYTNFAIIFLYFLDFCFSTTLLCYFVSAFFTRASIAILVTLIVYFLSYLPYMVLITLNIQMTFWQKTLACLSSTSAFGFAAQYLAMYEEQQIGIHWDNIGTSSINGDSASFSWCCIMMVIDAGIYLILGWYVRSVKPGKYGVSEPWWFPVCPSYWSSCCGSGSQDKYRTAEQGEHFEADTSRSPRVISVRGLSKEYKRGKPVVSDLNMDVHAGQVTTLLGHNGAAKTTTMIMLTGLLEPTSGDVVIFNRPLRNMKKSIGVCPQHNSLYKYMTVKEHMEFVQSVKSGASDASSKEEIRQILEEVNLWHCRHCNVQELSGGMQRRLCVALAFVGNSKAVILDEPTSGVDPSGRRAIWNLIIRKKGAIGVLLSTHHLDEAEVISDKVCVLHEGRLLCSGTPLFLKEKFSSGHRMTVETAVATDTEHSAIIKCIQNYVPSAVLKSSVDNEMKFVLPTSNRTNFYDLFRTLEERREELQIASFGVSDPTLEEVFLTVCKTTDILDMDREESEIVDLAQPLLEARYNTGGSWKFQQFGAMFVKRFHHYRRNWRLFLSAVLLPVLLFLAASGLHTVRPDATQRSLLLSPAIYGPDTYFFVNDHSHGQEAMSIYDTLMHSPGIATSCMDNMELYRKDHDLKCVDPATSYTVPDFTLNPNASCSCTDYKYTCTQGWATAPPRQRMTTTGDILQNLEGRNTDNYLFESFHEFIQKRYGGYSFEDDSDQSGMEPSLKSTVWYNNKGFHALPSFYSGLSNAVLRSRAQSMKNGDPEKYGITTFNHPFTFNVRQLSKDTILQSAADLGIAATIMLAFTFIPVGIVMYSVNEFINKEKHLQFTSGIGPALYWFTSFFWDLIVLVVTTALVFAVMAIFRHDSFWARHNAAGAIVLILLYGWATLPLVYCTTKLFNSASTAFLTMFCTLNFIGLVPICAVFVLNFYQHIEIIYDAYVVCQKVFLIFPTYALGAGLIDIMTNQIKTSIFERFGTDIYVDPFTLDLIGWNFIVLGIEGLAFFVFAVLLDACSACNCDCDSVDVESERYDDPEVQQEMARLVHRGHNEDTLVARNISKVYKRAGSNFLAVDHVTFGVSKGECFGLLGVNGAGKTTTFKIITGSLNATLGSIFFSPNGYQRGTTIWQNIGYCPQEEALDSFLTVEEMLEFFGKMRGLEGQSRKIAIRNVTENLKLQPILKKTVRTCSGGMKRKLSLAIALLGDPAFVLLDEPTTGMDPIAKRLAWNCIKTAKSKGQTIVLTSHSMEECDILCSRLSILVNGQMKCLGSPQHLKDKFGDTYTIMLHVCGPLARTGKIYELVQAYFPGASIREQHLDVIQLDIPKQTTSVSEIFRVLEREKENYNILYYTVSQNTLETIFLNFARDQHDSESEGTGSSDRSSDLTMPVDEESKLAGKPLPHTRYGYMNKAYEGFGEYPVPPSQKMADPRMVTLETDSFYDTKM